MIIHIRLPDHLQRSSFYGGKSSWRPAAAAGGAGGALTTRLAVWFSACRSPFEQQTDGPAAPGFLKRPTMDSSETFIAIYVFTYKAFVTAVNNNNNDNQQQYENQEYK